MALVPPPPPTKSEPGSFAWMSWYQSLYYYLTTAGSVTWASIDKTGSNLADLATRLHSSLQGVLGTGQYHISASEATNVTNLSGTNTGDQTITLTGDVTGSGTGSFAATLATVNANVGSFGSSTAIPSYTVNGKGLITASSTNTVVAPAGTLTGATLASGVTASSLTSVGTLTGLAVTAGSANVLATNSGGGGFQYLMATAGAAFQGKIGITTAGVMQFSNNNITSVTFGTAGELTGINSILSTSPTGGIGYTTGSGGTATQLTSRTTGVTLNKVNGAIAMFSAAGSATAATFTVTNSVVAATDVILCNQKSGTNLYNFIVTAVAAGSFNITFYTTGGTSVDAPVINFAVIKAVTS